MALSSKNKEMIVKIVFSCVALAVIAGYGLMIRKINTSQQQLSQIIREQNRLNTILMQNKTVSAPVTTENNRNSTPVAASPIQSDVLAREIIKELQHEIKLLSENIQSGNVDTPQNVKTNDDYSVEDREEYLNCVNYVDSLHEYYTVTEKEIQVLNQYAATLTANERQRINAELFRMLNSGEIELEDPALLITLAL